MTSPFLYNLTRGYVIFPEGLDALISTSTLLPQWFLWTFLSVTLIGGLITNGILVVYLARKKSFPAVRQLSVVDMASLLLLAPYETLVLADPAGSWVFPRVCCRVFLGIEVLLGTASVYLIVVANFSAASDSDSRSLKIPLLMVWSLAISLSVPEFIFGEVVSPRFGLYICCLPKRAALLISVFRLALPVLLLLVGTVAVILNFVKQQRANSLCTALVLSMTYMVISVQRSVFGAIYAVNSPVSGPEAFRTPPLADVTQIPAVTLILALMHYSLSVWRPLVVWCALPKFRSENNNPVVRNRVI